MKRLRRLHTYLGCFFAPVLLFFVITGWHQMFHDRQKNTGEAGTFWSRLSDVHVDQIFVTDAALSFKPLFFQSFTVLMSIALIVTVVLGVALAFQTVRPKWRILFTLGLGVLVPVALLWMGQRR